MFHALMALASADVCVDQPGLRRPSEESRGFAVIARETCVMRHKVSQ